MGRCRRGGRNQRLGGAQDSTTVRSVTVSGCQLWVGIRWDVERGDFTGSLSSSVAMEKLVLMSVAGEDRAADVVHLGDIVLRRR
jgi:hypothetical protein